MADKPDRCARANRQTKAERVFYSVGGVGLVSAQERLDLTDKRARMGVEMAEQPEPTELWRLSVCWLAACVMD